MWIITLWKRKRAKHVEPTQDVIDVDADVPAELAELEQPPTSTESADVPVYKPPPPQVMGDVQQYGMGAEQGIVPPAFYGKYRPPLPVLDDAKLLAELKKRRDELTARVDAIEDLLGFVESAGDLAVRVAKLERFLGLS